VIVINFELEKKIVQGLPEHLKNIYMLNRCILKGSVYI